MLRGSTADVVAVTFQSLIEDERSPEPTLMLTEDAESVMNQLDQSQRQILELRLHGHVGDGPSGPIRLGDVL